MKNVNLSNGPLDLFLAGVHMGRIPLIRGEGMLSTTLLFQVGRLDLIVISDGATDILFGGRCMIRSMMTSIHPPSKMVGLIG